MLSDGAAIEIGADVYYRVTEPTLSLAGVQDLNHSTRILGSTVMLKHLATHDLKDIQNSKHVIAQTLQVNIRVLTLRRYKNQYKYILIDNNSFFIILK